MVHSDVFPFQAPPKPQLVEKIKNFTRLLASYGIEYYIMIWESVLLALFTPLELYPPEVLVKVRRPWGGDENHLDTTICINHPMVQAHLWNLVQKLIKEYPYIRGFFFYNLDGSAWLCTPELCPCCAENLIDSDPAAHNPWETQVKIATILAEAAHEADPTFTFNFWGAIHFHGDAIPKMYDAAKGYDAITIRDGDPDNIPALREKYHALLHEGLELQRECGILLEQIAMKHPCLPMTGMCESEILEYREIAAERVEQLEQYLRENQ